MAGAVRCKVTIGAVVALLSVAAHQPAHADLVEFKLIAEPTVAQLGVASGATTEVWAYNGTVPGPTLRVRQGDRVRVVFENRLPEPTSVHWHGVRLTNAMDGAAPITQPPVRPGETFVYEFDAIDAGTFWYHPHLRSSEQVERGLAGALIVEERDPLPVDRDVTWLLDDWRLLPSGALSTDFANFMDASHNGRVGNRLTVNGAAPKEFAVAPGERLRLRLINAANARIFALSFAALNPHIIAIDGQPVAPHRPAEGRIVLAPAMRIDLVLDMTGRARERFMVSDDFYRGLEFDLIELAYGDGPASGRAGAPLVPLPANPLLEPDLAAATRHEVVLGGGMMGGMRTALLDGQPADMRELMRHGLAWAINGVAAKDHRHQPMLTVDRGSSQVLTLVNDTAWHHPMHLHGHSFRVISRNGQPTAHREWQDTVLVAPRERVEIAFVADNPGDWMFHCHILEHQAAGMDTMVRVMEGSKPDATSDPHRSHH